MMTEMTVKQYKTPIMKRIGGVLMLAAGALFLAATLYYAIQDIPLWVFGRQAKAEVVELWVEQLNQIEGREGGDLQFSYNLKYQFTAPSGKTITRTTKASASEWSGMWEGQKIDILYFPLYPNMNRLDDTRWSFFLTCTYIPLIAFGIIGLRVGWYMLRTP
jgi:hypothetical protein